MKPRWTEPVTHFDRDHRDSSMKLPGSTTLGPNAIEVFCNVVAFSGPILGFFYEAPWLVGSLLVGFVLVSGTFVVGTLRSSLLASAVGTSVVAKLAGPATDGFLVNQSVSRQSGVALYLRHQRLFLGFGAVFIPIGVLTTLIAARSSQSD